MFDAHNHLQFAEFDADRDEVIGRARDVGVSGMILAGFDDARREVAGSLAGQPGIGATAGLHPWAIGDDYEAQLTALETLDWSEFCALGELGLDWVRAKSESDRRRQIEVLRRQLSIARDADLPVVLHCVRANDELAKWLSGDGVPASGGIVHSFWGSSHHARRFVDLGLSLSIGTQITRAQPEKVVQALLEVGLNKLLVETDSPSRPPAGVDSDRNEPAFLPLVIEALAGALGEDTETVSLVTERNARSLFNVSTALG